MINVTVGLRLTAEEELLGCDVTEHGFTGHVEPELLRNSCYGNRGKLDSRQSRLVKRFKQQNCDNSFTDLGSEPRTVSTVSDGVPVHNNDAFDWKEAGGDISREQRGSLRGKNGSSSVRL